MERPVRHFQEELEALQTRLLEMGGLAEERVRTAVDSLVSRDVTQIERVLRGDVAIHQSAHRLTDALLSQSAHRE